MSTLSELRCDMARDYYSEDQNCVGDFIEILEEYEIKRSEWIAAQQNKPEIPDAVVADVAHLIGHLEMTLDIMEGEDPEKRLLRMSEIMQIRSLLRKVSEHFSEQK